MSKNCINLYTPLPSCRREICVHKWHRANIAADGKRPYCPRIPLHKRQLKYDGKKC